MGKKGHLTFEKGHLIFGGAHPLRYTTDILWSNIIPEILFGIFD